LLPGLACGFLFNAMMMSISLNSLSRLF